MVSLWGTKKDNDDQEEPQVNGGESADNSSNMARTSEEGRPRSRRAPNERDPLLPSHGPPHSDGYLDPDDPAVCSCRSCLTYGQ